MKGIIFTEFLTMVEKKFNMDMVDDIIESEKLSSGGAYTAVGTYDHREMNMLVGKLSEKTGIPLPDLLQAFGEYLFTTLATSYPTFLTNANGLIDFLMSIENYIHIEVLKLYPDAELPRFQSVLLDENTLELYYQSERHYGDLAHGLILGAITYYKSGEIISKEQLHDKRVKFTISANGK
jgi:hypothetical protein